MAGKSPVTATEAQKAALMILVSGLDRAEADRARAMLLTLWGWTIIWPVFGPGAVRICVFQCRDKPGRSR